MAVKVKPLEWIQTSAVGRFAAFGLLVGRYIADEKPGSGRPGWRAPGPDEDWILVDSLNEAKAAAQADYEARIRSCLIADDQP